MTAAERDALRALAEQLALERGERSIAGGGILALLDRVDALERALRMLEYDEHGIPQTYPAESHRAELLADEPAKEPQPC